FPRVRLVGFSLSEVRPMPPLRSTGRRLAAPLALAVLAAALSPSGASAQDALPVVRVSQSPGENSLGFGGTARVRLDRDAFLVVIEVGADYRARILYPMRPSMGAWARSDRSIVVPLPSADAGFIRATELRIPDIIAFASDVEPNLDEFTESGRRWDYQYAVSVGEPLSETVRSLAQLLFGDADMPYTVYTRPEYPVLPRAAFASLSSCGYNLNGQYSSQFNRFLWDAFGPMTLLQSGWNIEERYRNYQWEGPGWFLASMSPLFNFGRNVGLGLWNTFGAGCGPLQQQRPFLVASTESPRVPPPSDSSGGEIVPLPEDRDPKQRPPVVPGVELRPASPEEMGRRADAVTRVADARAEARAASRASGEARGPLTREGNQELVKRQEIATVMSLLAAQAALGQRGSVVDALARVRAGETTVAAGGQSGARGTRGGSVGRFPSDPGSSSGGGFRGSSGYGGGSSLGSGGGASGGGSSIGSGASSGGGAARGGGEARGGSGRGSGTGSP
ncbi:MAG: hypothetical protein MUD17_10090, partial [Gemmatimonadaceae bacterium]|nr:hypothetical protein [Gemmatimonadaceae bacterium]